VPIASGPRAANATLVAREDLSGRLARFRVRPDAGRLTFRAGQYVPLAVVDQHVPARPYSIASPPGARDLDFIITLDPDGALTPRLFDLGIGDRLTVGMARGLFRLDEGDDRDHLLVGTGSGVAPLLAMIAALDTRALPPRTILLHGARVPGELAGRESLSRKTRTWLSYRPTLSRSTAADAWTERTGRVDEHLKAVLARQEIEPRRVVAYVCGSPGMVIECEARLVEVGMTAEAVRTERFATL
jgi:ferredoxin-NADP reductase